MKKIKIILSIFIFFLNCSDYATPNPASSSSISSFSSSTSSNNSSSSSSSSSSYDPGPGWFLHWSDEFNEPTLNTNYWSYDIGYGDIPALSVWGWGLGQLQNFTTNSENSYFQDGNLVFKAIYTGGPLDGRNYTSARINSKDKISFKYGKIAARMKMPQGKGMFPAFWMFGTAYDYVTNWPDYGEIDIMEMKGGGENQDDTTIGTAHFSNDIFNYRQFISQTYEVPDPSFLSDNFYVYSIEWDKSNIVWQLDNYTYHTVSIDTNIYPERSELHNDMFLILNLAVVSWLESPGYPNTNTVFPQYMYIDWVRVYTN